MTPSVQCIKVDICACNEWVQLPLTANETGIWHIKVYFNNTVFNYDIAVVTGQPVIIPNKLNESYVHKLEIFNLSGELFNNTWYQLKTIPSYCGDGSNSGPMPPTIPTSVQAYDNRDSFPATGADSVIYIARDTWKQFVWDVEDSVYLEANTPAIIGADPSGAAAAALEAANQHTDEAIVGVVRWLNGLAPNEDGELELTAADINADPAGAAAAVLEIAAKIFTTKAGLSSKGAADSQLYFTVDTHEWFYLSTTDITGGLAGVAVASNDGKYWIPAYFVVNNTSAGNVQKSFPIRLGSGQVMIDQSVVFQGSAPVQITERAASIFGNPSFLAMSCPDSGTMNGFVFNLWGTNDKSGNGIPRIFASSNYAKAGNYDAGFWLIASCTEPATPGLLTQVIRLNPVLRTSDTSMWTSGNLVNPNTFAVTISPNPNAVTSINSAALWFGVRINGDIHIRGAEFTNTGFVTGDFTPALNVHDYEYTGTGNNTVTLPDPTDPANLNREIFIVNNGSNPLALSRSVKLDSVNTQTTIPATYPDNRLRIKANGLYWYKLN